MASQRQVVYGIGSTVLSRNNVLDVMRRFAVFLEQQAVFATVLCAAPDDLTNSGVHG